MTDADPLLTRKQTAEFLNVKCQTLAVWASRGHKGPPYHRIGGSVRYRLSDLEKYLTENRIAPQQVSHD